MFGISGAELFIILVFGFLIFGPEKLPDIARTVGKGIAKFRSAQEEMNGVLKDSKLYDPNSDEPFKNPIEALDKLAKIQEDKASGATAAEGEAANAVPAAAAAAPEVATDDAAPRKESFSERKARYERERAARRAAQEEAEARAAQDAAAAEAATETEAAPAAVPSSPAPAEVTPAASEPAKVDAPSEPADGGNASSALPSESGAKDGE